MSDSETVEALTDLGLSTYEARVFVALVRLGSGTARDVAEIADVPRPQVYTTTPKLEKRGFVSVQRSNPQVFRPVSLEEVKRHLERQFEQTRDTAFDHLASIEHQADAEPDDGAGVYSLTGSDAITERITQLVSDADEHVYYAPAPPTEPASALLDALEACCGRGVAVTVLRASDEDLPSEWEAVGCLRESTYANGPLASDALRRLLLVDDDVFVLSVGSESSAPATAVWSARTAVAAVLSPFILESIQ